MRLVQSFFNESVLVHPGSKSGLQHCLISIHRCIPGFIEQFQLKQVIMCFMLNVAADAARQGLWSRFASVALCSGDTPFTLRNVSLKIYSYAQNTCLVPQIFWFCLSALVLHASRSVFTRQLAQLSDGLTASVNTGSARAAEGLFQ